MGKIKRKTRRQPQDHERTTINHQKTVKETMQGQPEDQKRIRGGPQGDHSTNMRDGRTIEDYQRTMRRPPEDHERVTRRQ